MNSEFESQIENTIKNAFWNLLKDDLEAEPQRFNHLMILIEEIKLKLKSLTPHRNDIHDELDQYIDIDFLRNLFETKGFEPTHFFNLIKYLMNKIKLYSAPYMDMEVNQWECNTFELLQQEKIEYSEFIRDFFTKYHFFLDKIQEDIQKFKQTVKNHLQ